MTVVMRKLRILVRDRRAPNYHLTIYQLIIKSWVTHSLCLYTQIRICR